MKNPKHNCIIQELVTEDRRFSLPNGAGSDAVHKDPIYAYAVCKLKGSDDVEGVGLAFTLGMGNKLVCDAIEYLSSYVVGKEINELMSDFGVTIQNMSNDPYLRWLGPQKGVVHLALASIVNACFDLWAKVKEVPLWKLLLDLPHEQLLNTLDFSYYDDVLSREEALELLQKESKNKAERESILEGGYPGYDTSIGWFGYSDDQIKENIKISMQKGFTAMKLKVGSEDAQRDLRRAEILRNTAGDEATIMFDANQKWSLNEAIEMCTSLKKWDPYWIEEPTHPDDIRAHVTLAEKVDVPLALGEHVPNKIVFKNYLQSGCMSFNQVDAVRVGGVSEYIIISILSRKFGIPVVPHVGDMGQIHQHLVLFNHIVLGHPKLFLEYIPHLKEYFKYPAIVENGHYKVPHIPGMSTDLVEM